MNGWGPSSDLVAVEGDAIELVLARDACADLEVSHKHRLAEDLRHRRRELLVVLEHLLAHHRKAVLRGWRQVARTKAVERHEGDAARVRLLQLGEDLRGRIVCTGRAGELEVCQWDEIGRGRAAS